MNNEFIRCEDKAYLIQNERFEQAKQKQMRYEKVSKKSYII